MHRKAELCVIISTKVERTKLITVIRGRGKGGRNQKKWEESEKGEEPETHDSQPVKSSSEDIL